MEVFREVTPLVEPLSLDEAFLDVSGAVRRLGPPAAIGETIRARVADEQGVTCSVGVASTKFVAKLATTRAKPDGLLVVPRDGVVTFLHPLPVVGAVGGGGAHRGGADPARAAHRRRPRAHPAGHPRAGARPGGRAPTWPRSPGAATSAASSPHEPDKSIGAEETFATDVDDPTVIHRELLRLSERVASRLRSAGYAGRTVALKVRFADFTTITRSRTLREATDVGQELYATARSLYDALGLQRARIRLVGVRMEGLVDADDPQPSSCSSTHPSTAGGRPSWPSTPAARRFGPGAVRPGSLVRGPRPEGQRRPRPTAAVVSPSDPAGGPRQRSSAGLDVNNPQVGFRARRCLLML